MANEPITYTELVETRDWFMGMIGTLWDTEWIGTVSIILVKPDATNTGTAGVFLVKDPRADANPATAGNAKSAWKPYSVDALRLAYP